MPTFRRPDGLARVLEGLRAQVAPDLTWDVVVVDNDASSAIPLVQEAAVGFPVPLRVVAETKRGAANARNRGIAEAAGEVIVFIDDDVVPDPGWLAALVEPIVSGRCQATGGRVVLDPSVPRPAWFNEERLGGYLAAFDLGDEERDVPREGYVLTASAAFLASALREAGGMDPALGPRSGVPLVNDDVQLCRALVARGARLRYVPGAVVVHELPESRLTRRYIARRLYAQGRSDYILQQVQPLAGESQGLRAVVDRLTVALRSGLRQGVWRRWVASWIADELAYTAGYVRELTRGSGPRWRR